MKRIIFLSVAVMFQGALLAGDSPRPNLVAHEWGTFTSFQGGDGALLSWKPLETSKLPGFVYDWTRPGLGRRRYMLTKDGITSLQRMETPVVYFYSDKEQKVDLEVKFPQGQITEWYPQAREVGPSIIPPSPALTETDALLRRVGAPPSVSLVSLLGNKPVAQSLIHWTGIDVLPPTRRAKATELLPMDRSGSHYFAARETDSACLGLDSLSRTNAPVEYEKFLFYRGIGSFATPLTVTMKTNDSLTVTNTGKETLRHLFVLKVKNQTGHFIHLDELPAGQEKMVPITEADLPLPKLADKLCGEMAEALVARGLYPREAKAMVNTWKDSWFAEEGVRVLYVLPREWTDRTLPMEIKPAPKELVRVMVGRAEVLTPETEGQLASLVTRADDGDTQAMKQLKTRLEELGRFAEPALFRAMEAAKAPQESREGLLALLTTPQPKRTENGIAAREVGAR